MTKILDSIEEALKERNREKDSELAATWATLLRAAADELTEEESSAGKSSS